MAIGDKKSAVMQSDIVNDFTTGGAKNVLSAEIGKTIYHTGNKPTPADIGAAPAGFGLGELYGADIPEIDGVRSFNNATKIGWYYTYPNDTYSDFPPQPEATVGYNFLRVERYRKIVQTYYWCRSPGYFPVIWQRCSDIDTATSWTEWECLNPPMYEGVEYRTSERYMNKPVYIKAMSMSALPATPGTEVRESFSENDVLPFDFGGYLSSFGCAIPFSGIANLKVTTTQFVVVAEHNLDGAVATVWVKYIYP